MHGGDSEIRLAHLRRQPIDLHFRVDKDHRLRDRQNLKWRRESRTVQTMRNRPERNLTPAL